MDFLTVMTPEGRTFRREIGAESLRIGRSTANELVLQDLNVSRLHAEVVRRPEGCYILDAGGKNGTFVNDRRIGEATRLHPGDRVRLGTITLIFNGGPTSPVELCDRPLPAGLGTTVLPAGEIRTPSLRDVPSLVEGPPHPAGSAPAGPGTDRRRTARTATSAPGSSEARTASLTPSLSILFEADQELVFHRPVGELLETIMDLARRAVPFERGVLMLLQGGRLVSQVVRVPPDEAGRTISISRTITDRVVLNKESVLTSDAQIDERFRQGQSVEAQRLRSVLCVPLWNNREVIGLLYVDNRHRAGLFSEDDLRLLTCLANVAAVKIENARLFEQSVAAEMMKRELQTAAEIQNRLLPAEAPPIPGYLLCGSSLPCGAVGGDYFDFVELPGGRLVIALGDVAGKGLPAALLMCSFQASVRALVELDLPPAETIARLNRLLLSRIPENRFVTFFYGVLDHRRHTLDYVNAGQTPPCLVRARGDGERLAGTGPALGLLPEGRFDSMCVSLAAGDLLVCYSDGVTEAADRGEEHFGEERLARIAREAREAPADDMVRRITTEVGRHCEGLRPQDDMTLVVVRRVT